MTSNLLRPARLFAALAFSAGCAFAQAQDNPRCSEVSKLAKTNGDKLLIVAFEGLLQYVQGPIDQFYTYQTTGRGSPPQLNEAGGDLITTGLLSPLAEKFGDKFQTVVFSYSDEQAGEDCAITWMTGAAGRKVMLIGHSAGGPAASDVANDLAERGVSVDSVFTIDSCSLTTPLSRPSEGVGLWDNFYETNFGSGCMGFPPQELQGANVQEDLSSEATHMDIPGAPTLVQAVEARVTQDISGG